ncbi:MAG: transglycosylase [Bacteroidetes bacterium GWF2_29_10]|nr:MAG: transglycosylase [Bacteroidetes bacterium GWF2_29_10]
MLLKKTIKYFIFIIAFLIVLYFAIIFNLLWLFGSTPEIKKGQELDINYASEVYTREGVLIGKFYKEHRDPIANIKELNPIIIKALLATEDIRFYEHKGVDFEATMSIVWYMLKGDNRGGSTITQQLVKNIFQTRSKKINNGLLGYIPIVKILIIKLKEWITAYNIEKIYSKDEILLLYFNTVPFGNNTFGIKVASRIYFNKLPEEINIQEAALLIGMLKATSFYNPLKNPEKAIERRNVVIDQMLKYKFVTKQEHDDAINKPLGLDYTPYNSDNINFAEHFQNAVSKNIKNILKAKGYDIYSDGLKIFTSLDYSMQVHAESSVEEQLKRLQKKFNNHWEGENPWIDEKNNEIPNYIENIEKRTDLYKALKKKYRQYPDSVDIIMNTPRKMKVFTWNGEKDTMLTPMDSIRYYKRFLQAGFITMDPFTGEVLTWIGSINNKYFKYDHVSQSKRQSGSTFKPFVYTAAIDKGGYSPCDRIIDHLVTIRYEENGEKKSWTPQNADWEYTNAPMTLRRALGRSINSVTVQLTEIMTPKVVAEYANKMGIKSKLKAIPSIGLGSNEVSLFEMINAYCTFVNGGFYVEPKLVTRVYDRHWKLIHEFKTKKNRVITKESAFLMTYMLRGGVEEPGGTSQALFEWDIFRGNEVGGKTGTTSNYSDGWFIGITKDLVSGAWVGGDDRCIRFRSSEKAEGCRTALPIYGIFMEKIFQDTSIKYKPARFPSPDFDVKKEYKCTSYHEEEPEDLESDSIYDEEFDNYNDEDNNK